MRQFFLALSFTLAIGISSFANPVVENPTVEKAFRQLFTGASNVTWSKEEGNLLCASFTWGDHHTLAFFDNEARLVGSIRGLFFSQLPLSVIRSFNKAYNDHVVIEVREISNDEGISYTIISESKNKKYKLRMDSLGSLIDKTRVKE